MEVIIRPDIESAVNLTARLIADSMRAKPDITLGLATGRTMEALYAELSRMHREEGLDFSLAKTFNLDEYIGLPAENVNSYRYYMNRHLFDNINIDKRNTHLPDGMAGDDKVESARYEGAIRHAGGIDIQLLGIGRDGHIGFNEPLSSLASRTRAKALTPETYAQNSPLFDNPADMPKRAFTMGVGTIMDARRVFMLVTGKEKAGIFAKAVEGPVTAMISATALQYHPNTVVICDEAAAELLTGAHDFVFQNEPEWEPYRVETA